MTKRKRICEEENGVDRYGAAAVLETAEPEEKEEALTGILADIAAAVLGKTADSLSDEG